MQQIYWITITVKVKLKYDTHMNSAQQPNDFDIVNFQRLKNNWQNDRYEEGKEQSKIHITSGRNEITKVKSPCKVCNRSWNYFIFIKMNLFEYWP